MIRNLKIDPGYLDLTNPNIFINFDGVCVFF